MAYKADEYCRRSGPVGNGASRGYGRYNEPGHFDDYGYFIPDPQPQQPDPYYEEKAKREAEEAEERVRKQKEEAEEAQRRRQAQSDAAQQPEPSGLGALPIVAGIFVGIAAAKAESERKRRMSPPPVVTPQKAPAKQDDTDGPLAVYCYLLFTVAVIAVFFFGLMALFFRGSWLRFLLTLVLTIAAIVPLDKIAHWKP